MMPAAPLRTRAAASGGALIGAVLFFEAPDQVQAVDPQGGNVKPLACYKNCLLSKFWAFLRYLQKQQRALLALVRDAHGRDSKPHGGVYILDRTAATRKRGQYQRLPIEAAYRPRCTTIVSPKVSAALASSA